MTRVIFFDAAGTLLHLPRGVGWHYREVALRHGADLGEEELNRAFRAVWRTVDAPRETRVPREDDDRGWWRVLVFQVLDACAAGASMDRAAYFEELWEEFAKPGVWELYPETREVLTALRGRFRMGVLSNFDSRLRRILPCLGIGEFFEEMIVSSEVGAEKPSAFIYEEALRRFGVRAGEALHVGDEPEADWRGARAAGMQVFELRRPGKTLRDLLSLTRAC